MEPENLAERVARLEAQVAWLLQRQQASTPSARAPIQAAVPTPAQPQPRPAVRPAGPRREISPVVWIAGIAASIFLLGAIFFKERMGRRSVAGALVCFAGVVLIFWDSSSPSLLGDSLGLLSGVLAGYSIHYTKRAREKNGAEIVYLAVCLSGILVTFWTAPRALTLDLRSGLILLASAVLGYGGQIAMTWGVKFMDASEAGILSFLKIPLVIFFGLFLGEGLSLRFAAGTLVLVAGLAVAELGRRRKGAGV